MKYDKNFTRAPKELSNRYYLVDGVHPDEAVGHSVIIPEDAIADRIQLYGLTTEQEVLDHIMWEHHIRLNPDLPDSVLPASVKANFDRVWGPGHKAARGFPLTREEHAQQSARMDDIRNPKGGTSELRNPRRMGR
jgi:hypothetical protein